MITIALETESTGDYSFSIVGSGSPEPDIESVSVSGPDEALVYIHLGGVRDVGDISRIDGGELIISGEIERDLVGTVVASGVGNNPSSFGLTVRGDVTGDVELYEPTTVIAGDGRVILFVDGNLTGNIEVPFGAVNTLIVQGNIGTPLVPVDILSELDIGSLEATEIHANVEAGWYGPTSNIRAITTAGNFTGSILANTIGAALNYDDDLEGLPGVNIVGDLGEDGHPATVEFTGGLDVADARYLKVDGSFVDGSTITLPTGGLVDQIIFNAADDSGAWESGAEVVVGATTLTNASYATLPSTLGGGTVGLAPFDLHGVACSPADGSSIVGKGPGVGCFTEPPCCFTFKTAKIRMYGPVDTDDDECVTVKVWNGGSAFVAVGWTVRTEQISSTEVLVTRDGDLMWPLGTYLIEPVSDKFTCVDVEGAPDVADFDYTFTLVENCSEESFAAIFDQNNDGFMTSADMTAWLSSPVDLNNDNSADTDDLFRLKEIDAIFN